MSPVPPEARVPGEARVGTVRVALLWMQQRLAGPLARGALLSLCATAAATATGFALQFVLARSLGVNEYGLYIYALGWLNVLMMLAKLEVDTATIRYLGEYLGTGRWALAKGFAMRAAQTVSASGLTTALAVGLIVVALGTKVPDGRRSVFLLAMILLPLSALMQLAGAGLQASKRVLAAQLPSGVLRPALVGLGIGTMWLAGMRTTAVTALYMQVAVSVGVLAQMSWLFVGTLNASVRASAPEYATKEWTRTAGGLLMVSAGQLILGMQTDIVVVGTLVGQAAAGQYSVAMQLASAPQLFVTAVLFVVMPLISEYYHSGRRDRLQELVRTVARVNLLVCLPLLVGMIAFGRQLLALFGPAFPAAYPVLIVGTLNMIHAAIIGWMGGYLLTMTGHQERAAVIMAGSAAVYVVLVPILAPRFGAVGVAVATLTAYLVRAVVLYFECRRLVGVSLIDFVLPSVARAEAP